MCVVCVCCPIISINAQTARFNIPSSYIHQRNHESSVLLALLAVRVCVRARAPVRSCSVLFTRVKADYSPGHCATG